MGLQVERAELVHADDDLRITIQDVVGAIHQPIQVQDPVLLGLEGWVAGLLPGLDHLKGHALLAEQGPQALMADIVDHPLSDQEVGQLGQRPGREGQVMVDRAGQRGLLDLAPLDEGEGGRAAAGIARIQRVEPVQVEVVQHIADPVGAGEGHLGDHRNVHRLGAEQHHLRSPPGHHRPGAAPHDAQQPVALLVGEVSHPDPLGHPASFDDPMSSGVSTRMPWSRRPAISSQPGQRCRLRR
jgi:hypothetical protein